MNDKTVEEVSTYQVPYYLENFKTIMDNVLRESDYARLFDDADMKYVFMFNDLQEDDLKDLGTVLKILAAPDLKALAKSFHISGAGLTKHKTSELLLKKSQQNSISAMFEGGAKGNMENVIFCRAKSHLGRVCRLNETPRGVFMRVIMLFSLSDIVLDDESGGQKQLFQMLMVSIGKIIYPAYTVNKQKSVFADRAALMRWDVSLPLFLRIYTASYVYVRIYNQSVDILQRLKLYAEAVSLLEELLM